jgi:hypothetical protein
MPVSSLNMTKMLKLCDQKLLLQGSHEHSRYQPSERKCNRLRKK